MISSPFYRFVIPALFLIAAPMAHADTIYNDGASHTINNTASPTIDVGPNTATTVNVVHTALVSAGSGSDAFNIAGGTVNISGGSVTGGSLAEFQTGDVGAIY